MPSGPVRLYVHFRDLFYMAGLVRSLLTVTIEDIGVSHLCGPSTDQAARSLYGCALALQVRWLITMPEFICRMGGTVTISDFFESGTSVHVIIFVLPRVFGQERIPRSQTTQPTTCNK